MRFFVRSLERHSTEAMPHHVCTSLPILKVYQVIPLWTLHEGVPLESALWSLVTAYWSLYHILLEYPIALYDCKGYPSHSGAMYLFTGTSFEGPQGQIRTDLAIKCLPSGRAVTQLSHFKMTSFGHEYFWRCIAPCWVLSEENIWYKLLYLHWYGLQAHC